MLEWSKLKNCLLMEIISIIGIFITVRCFLLVSLEWEFQFDILESADSNEDCFRPTVNTLDFFTCFSEGNGQLESFMTNNFNDSDISGEQAVERPQAEARNTSGSSSAEASNTSTAEVNSSSSAEVSNNPIVSGDPENIQNSARGYHVSRTQRDGLLGTMRELYSQLVNADSGWLSDDESVKSKKSDSVKSDDLCKFENMHTHLIEDNQTDMLGMLEKLHAMNMNEESQSGPSNKRSLDEKSEISNTKKRKHSEIND